MAIRLFPADVNHMRFEREIAPLRGLSPFCTAQIIGTGVADGRPYLVSEYVEGPTLREQVEAHGALETSELHRLAVNTMTALVAVHQAGVAHLDLRPENVVLGEGGARVLGFGVARALETTDSGTTRAVESPAFVAPEQLRGEGAGPPADLFAWAATIAYAATGRSVFDAGSMSGTVNRVLNGEPDLSGVDQALLPALRSCLAKDPADRPAASDVLLRLVGEASLTTRTEAPAPPSTPAFPQGGARPGETAGRARHPSGAAPGAAPVRRRRRRPAARRCGGRDRVRAVPGAAPVRVAVPVAGRAGGRRGGCRDGRDAAGRPARHDAGDRHPPGAGARLEDRAARESR